MNPDFRSDSGGSCFGGVVDHFRKQTHYEAS